jgi:sporulation protein YlmC with PRC-barrel domain
MHERAEVLRTGEMIGQTVTDPEGAAVGTVADLLFGRDGRVRFLAVRRGRMGSSFLVPADEVTWGEGAMRLTRWTAEEARRLPSWDPERPLSADLLDEMGRAHPRHYAVPPLWDAPRDGAGDPIVPLSEAKEFRIPKDAPDPTGWIVFGADNERVGKVAGLLVDPRAMRVRYLVVDVSDDLFLLREDRQTVVPMEAVELRERGRDVWIRGLPAREVARLPAYAGGALDPVVREAADAAFASAGERDGGFDAGRGDDLRGERAGRVDGEPEHRPERGGDGGSAAGPGPPPDERRP